MMLILIHCAVCLVLGVEGKSLVKFSIAKSSSCLLCVCRVSFGYLPIRSCYPGQFFKSNSATTSSQGALPVCYPDLENGFHPAELAMWYCYCLSTLRLTILMRVPYGLARTPFKYKSPLST